MTTTQTSDYDYDYLVLGGGSGGVSSAKRAATLYGARVAIVEAAAWGGTCVNQGCVPKKILYQAAGVYEAVTHQASHYEISDASPSSSTAKSNFKFDWKALKTKREAYIARLNGIYLNGLVKAGVAVFEGWGTLVDPHTISVALKDGNVKQVTAAHICIAVGGKPSVPGVFDQQPDLVMDSDDFFFRLEEQPAKAVVVGAGYIAVELAGVLHALGTETHLVVRKHQALRSFDPDIGSFLDATMVKDGVNIHRNTEGVAKVDRLENGQKQVTTVSGEVIGPVDLVLMAAGRVPNTDKIGLEAAGIAKDPKTNYIAVDEYQNTNIPGVYALGDVTGNVELTPMAIAAGRRLADRVFGGKASAKASYELVPTVVFSHPTIGTIGLTEPQAVSKYGQANLKIYKSTFVNLQYSMFNMAPSEKPKTFVKLVCAGVSEQVVGMHICGMAADELLQGFGVAMKMGATKADFDAVVAIHPTAAEEVVTMGTWGTSPQYSGAKVPPLDGAAAPEPVLEHPKPESKM